MDQTVLDHAEPLPDVIDPVLVPSDEKISDKRKRSTIYTLAKTVGQVLFDLFKEDEKIDPSLSLEQTWSKAIYLLASFDIQIIVKVKEEVGRDGVSRMTFFISQHLPRPMSSFKLPSKYAKAFFNLNDVMRATASRTFSENKLQLRLDKPYEDFHDPEVRKEAMINGECLLSKVLVR